MYGIDVSTLGTYKANGTHISGTANKVTVPNFGGEGVSEEGYFFATNIQPNDGVEIRTNTNPDKWIKLYGGDEHGDLLILLGKDAPTMEWFEAKDANGVITRYDFNVTAAATIALSAQTPVVKKSTSRKSTKKTDSK